MSFLSILCIMFIGLKLMGFIAWSWFWVLSPIVALVLLYVIVFYSLFYKEKVARALMKKKFKLKG